MITGDGIQVRKFNKMLTKDDNKLKVKFEYVYQGFHHGPITGLDICVQRPLVVTCSREDSTIRIWNYVNFKCELGRKFIYENTDESSVKPL